MANVLTIKKPAQPITADDGTTEYAFDPADVTTYNGIEISQVEKDLKLLFALVAGGIAVLSMAGGILLAAVFKR